MRKLLLSTAMAAAVLCTPAVHASSELAQELIRTGSVKIDNQNPAPLKWMQPINLSMAQLTELLKGPSVHKMDNGHDYKLELMPLNAELMKTFLDLFNEDNNNANPASDKKDKEETDAQDAKKPETTFLLTPSLTPSFHTLTYLEPDPENKKKLGNIIEEKVVELNFVYSNVAYRETKTTLMDWNVSWALTALNVTGVQIPVELIVSEHYDIMTLKRDHQGIIYPDPQPLNAWFMKPPVAADKESDLVAIPQPAPYVTPAAAQNEYSSPQVAIHYTPAPAQNLAPEVLVLPPVPDQVPAAISQTLLGLLNADQKAKLPVHFCAKAYRELYPDANGSPLNLSPDEYALYHYIIKGMTNNHLAPDRPIVVPAKFDAQLYLSENPRLYGEAQSFNIKDPMAYARAQFSIWGRGEENCFTKKK